MELFAETVNIFQPLTFIAKRTLDVWALNGLLEVERKVVESIGKLNRMAQTRLWLLDRV